jgi:hypothetical protein
VDSGLLPLALPIPKISGKEYKVGAAVELFGLNRNDQLVVKKTEISTIGSVQCVERATPSWHITNTECYDLADCPATMGGVLVDPSDSSLIAFWMEVQYQDDVYGTIGIDFHHYIVPVVEVLASRKSVECWTCGCIFGPLHLARALDLEVPEHHAARITAIAKGIGTGPHAIWVVEKKHQFESGLLLGDFILEIDNEPVGRMADIELLSRAEFTKVLVLRDGKEVEVTVKSTSVSGQGPSRIVCWAGVILQVTPTFALAQTTTEFARIAEKEGIADLETLVYVCSTLPGSPAFESRGLAPYRWILEVNKQKITSMEVLLDVIATLKGRNEDDEYVQVKLISKEGIVFSVGVKLSAQFWPCWLLEWRETEWLRTELE